MFCKNASGNDQQKVYFTCIKKYDIVPEDVKACVLLQCFCQTSSTVRSNAIGGETKQQSNNHSQMARSLFDKSFIRMETFYGAEFICRCRLT